QQLSQRMALFTLSGSGYLLSLFLLMVTLTFILLLPLSPGRLIKPTLALFTLFCAIISYFSDRFGVIFDLEMVRNVHDNLSEGNRAEALELLSWDLVLYLLLHTLPFWFWLYWVEIKPAAAWWRDLGRRLSYGFGIAALTVVLVLLNYKTVSLFSRENRDLRYHLNPIFALGSIAQFYRNQTLMAMPFETINGSIQRDQPHPPLIGVLIVGETARGDHLQLNGYAEPTSPLLSQRQDLYNFSHASSCGTATAYSLPCIFSLMGKDDYSPEHAEKQSNLLDLLQDAGINLYWLDNNSGCKGICGRLPEHHYLDVSGSSEERFDEVLLTTLREQLKNVEKDTLIVLHLLGSHGPAYYKRYPHEFASFQPDCQLNTPHDCPVQELINSYDNTLLYTDYIINSVITELSQIPPTMNTFMLYASDHGESLGENGIYLHGLPYALAPSAQTHIPMMLWLSPQLNLSIIETSQPVSHDNISHTVLELFHVTTPPLQPQLSLVQPTFTQ
ncbi:MAG: sulfatase-like hydrolase/transferase, partial [Gammaproteobacteria bacterium]|nr:sulfatase-like hydrolase/transferase [Gammaproteobacteria bacterium]